MTAGRLLRIAPILQWQNATSGKLNVKDAVSEKDFPGSSIEAVMCLKRRNNYSQD